MTDVLSIEDEVEDRIDHGWTETSASAFACVQEAYILLRNTMPARDAVECLAQLIGDAPNFETEQQLRTAKLTNRIC